MTPAKQKNLTYRRDCKAAERVTVRKQFVSVVLLR